MNDLRCFPSGHHPALRGRKHPINRSKEITYYLCYNKGESYHQFLLRFPAFGVNRHRLDLGTPLGDLIDILVEA